MTARATIAAGPTRQRAKHAVIILTPTCLGLAVVAVIFGLLGITNGSVVTALELTARIALIMFLITFVARPLRDLTGWRWTQRLVVERKWTGLSFALAMGSHLVLIATLFVINAPLPPPMIGPSDYVLGGPGLLAIAVLSVLSMRRLRLRVGQPVWRFVNLVGMTWIWTVFVMCFLVGAPARGEDTDAPYLWVPLTLCLAAMAIRVVAALSNQWRGKSPGASDLVIEAGVIALYLFIALGPTV